MRFGSTDDGCLLRDSVVVVNHTYSAERRHGNGHGGLGDGVHRRSDAGDGEGDVAAELSGEVDAVDREVDVAREKDDIIVSVRVALVEQSLSCKSVVVHGGGERQICTAEFCGSEIGRAHV